MAQSAAVCGRIDCGEASTTAAVDSCTAGSAPFAAPALLQPASASARFSLPPCPSPALSSWPVRQAAGTFCNLQRARGPGGGGRRGDPSEAQAAAWRRQRAASIRRRAISATRGTAVVAQSYWNPVVYHIRTYKNHKQSPITQPAVQHTLAGVGADGGSSSTTSSSEAATVSVGEQSCKHGRRNERLRETAPRQHRA